MIERIRNDRRAVGGGKGMSVIGVGFKVTLVSALAMLLGFGPMASTLEAQIINPTGQAAEGKNMRLVGHDDLQGRSVYKGEVHEENGRFIAYVGHGDDPDSGRNPGERLNPLTGAVEPNGTSIVDVTDPRNPKLPLPHSGPSARLGTPGLCRRRSAQWSVWQPIPAAENEGRGRRSTRDVGHGPQQAGVRGGGARRSRLSPQILVGMFDRHRLLALPTEGMERPGHVDFRPE